MTRSTPTKSAGAAPGTAGVRAARRPGIPSSRRSTSSTRSCASSASQVGVPEPPGDRRRRPFGGRPVRVALRDGEPRARHARRAGHLRRRKPVELCVAGRDPAAAGRRCGARQRQGRVEHRDAAHEILVRSVRRRRMRQLRQLAGRIREPDERLHREDVGRSAEEAAGRRGRPPICWARWIRCRSAASTPRVRPWRRARRGERGARHSSSTSTSVWARSRRSRSCPSADTTIAASTRPTRCCR